MDEFSKQANNSAGKEKDFPLWATILVIFGALTVLLVALMKANL